MEWWVKRENDYCRFQDDSVPAADSSKPLAVVLRASKPLLVLCRRVDISLIDSQVAEPGALEPDGYSGRTAAPVGQQVFGNRIVRADYLLFRRLGQDSFLLHLADHLIHTMVGRLFPTLRADKGRYQVKVPVAAFAFLHPSCRRHGSSRLPEPVDEALPVLNI